MSIYKKIPDVMKEIGHIEKSRQPTAGSGMNYKFRGIDDVMAAVQPLFHKHGVFCAPNVLEQIREERQSRNGGVLIYTVLKVRFDFWADDGSHVQATTVGEAMDTSDKSSNKAMSAAMKYALVQILCIPTEGDNDTENSNPEPTTKAQRVHNQVQQKASPTKQGDEYAFMEQKSQPTNAPSVSFHPLATYPFPAAAKRYTGKRLGDVSMGELIAYRDQQLAWYAQEKRQPNKVWQELFDNIEEFTTVKA